METAENKYITVAYKLYTMEDGEKELFEEAKAEHPFQFISGLGNPRRLRKPDNFSCQR